MNTANLLLWAIILASSSQIFYLIFQARKQRLEQREKLVNQQITFGLFDRDVEAIGDGYIFCSLWRLSHVRQRAEALGYVVDLKDCYAIVARIKREFDPNYGVSYKVIDYTIEAYIGEQVREYRRLKKGLLMRA